MRAGDYESALETLLARAADPEQRDAARESMVQIFGELGQAHPVASAYRKRLAALLY